MLKATIKQWQAGIDAYKAGNFSEAQSCFKSIDDTSKILYCLGVVYFKQNNYAEAANIFGKSVRCDPFLAVSYFMRGVSCHLKNDLSNAVIHYDEAIQALRGHEYIDYKQLGMDYKLLLCEILFNKALCLAKSGRSDAVAQLTKSAASCKLMRDEKGRYRFEDSCNSVAAGNTNSPPFSVPHELMFQPPRIKAEKKGPSGSDAPPARPAPTPSRPTASLPPTPLSPSSSSPSYSPSPSYSSSPASSSYSSSSSSSTSNALPAVPKKPGGKKLPPRPISLKIEAAVITIKCFYKDRRLIQISASDPDFGDLQDKIRAKFGVDDLQICYQNGAGDCLPIRNLTDLQNSIEADLHTIYLGLEGDVNDFEPNAKFFGSSSPAKSNGFRLPNTAAVQPTSMSRAASSNIPKMTPQPIAKPATLQQPTSLSKSVSQPVKAFNQPAVVVSPVSTSPKFGNNVSPTAKAIPAIPAKPVKKKNVWQECYTDDGEKYFFNTETQETSWDPDIEPTPPWMVCFTDGGDKYYYNPSTDASSWEFPG